MRNGGEPRRGEPIGADGRPGDPLGPAQRAALGVHRPGPLDGMDLAIFDKDGTLIDFHLMWSDWVRSLALSLETIHGANLDDVVYATMGVDPVTARIDALGALAATPMARLRASLIAALEDGGLDPAEAERLVAATWHAPNPVDLARPLSDLQALFIGLRAAGTRIAVATSDDRDPTEQTLRHLGVDDLIDAVACADDGRAVKPSPDAVHWICRTLGVAESRTAVIGDAPADLRMGRSADVGLVIGVLTGVGDAATLGEFADLILASIADLLPAA